MLVEPLSTYHFGYKFNSPVFVCKQTLLEPEISQNRDAKEKIFDSVGIFGLICQCLR